MILKNPAQIVIDEVNRRNSTALTLENVTFTNVRVPTTPEEIAAALGKNAMATLTALPGAPGLGKETVYYNRRDITEMFASYGSGAGEYITLAVDLDNSVTAQDTMAAFLYYYGIYVAPTDVEPALIDKTQLTVRVRFEPHAAGFTGEVIVKLVPGGAFLAPSFPNNVVTGPYSYPYFNTKVGQGAVYAYGYIFDDYAQELKNANTTFSVERLAQILTEVTNHPWEVFRLPKEYNLKEAVIAYNGPNHSSFKSNPLAENVMIINLSLFCINLGGQMILHYADPS